MKKKIVAFSKAKYVVVHKVESRILFVGLGTKPCPCTCETGVLPCSSIPTWALPVEDDFLLHCGTPQRHSCVSIWFLANVSMPRILTGARDLTGYSRYRLHDYSFISRSLRCRISQEFQLVPAYYPSPDTCLRSVIVPYFNCSFTSFPVTSHHRLYFLNHRIWLLLVHYLCSTCFFPPPEFLCELDHAM